MTSKAFKRKNDEIVDNGGSRANKTIINSAKSLMHMPNIGDMRKPAFLLPNTKNVFNYLRQAFIKAIIFQLFDLKSHI